MYAYGDANDRRPASVVAPSAPTPNFGVQPMTITGSRAPSSHPLVIQRNRTTTRAPAKAPARYVPRTPAKPPARVGSGPTGNIAPVTQPPPPAPPSIDEWLGGDSTFQSQNNALSKAWADYQNNAKLQTDQYTNQYNTNKDQLGKQKIIDQSALEDDYASRGLMNSGLYGKAFTDFTNDYATKFTNLDTAKSDFLANLLAAQQGFQSDQQVQTDKARQDAINRRAAQYGL